ncbi:hypothetical protein DXX92_05675 [Thalassotalea euphylliae]|uniref:Uncharacterized protein n=2 Tax=Thalassotalea euphylliae TaxID=1655234 RepID=A0A3E0UGL4_9GAMM|nr:hypothetical protein DXX92_05675 [Thalassotalea euphylliae]
MLCFLVFLSADMVNRIIVRDNTNVKDYALPELSKHIKEDDIASANMLEKYLKFDVRWQQAVQQEKSQGEKEQQESVEVLSIVAIFNDKRPWAIASIKDGSDNFLESRILNLEDSVGEYRVKGISTSSLSLSNNDETVELTLFKESNRIQLSTKINTNEN